MCTCRTLEDRSNGAFDKSQEACSPNKSVCFHAFFPSSWLLSDAFVFQVVEPAEGEPHRETNTIHPPLFLLLSTYILCSGRSVNRAKWLWNPQRELITLQGWWGIRTIWLRKWMRSEKIHWVTGLKLSCSTRPLSPVWFLVLAETSRWQSSDECCC